MSLVTNEKSSAYSQWANQNSFSVFAFGAVLILIFVPIFHWIMPSLDSTVYDSLTVRLLASLPAAVLLILSFFKPFKRYLLLFHVLQLSAMLWGMFWVSGLAGFTPYYLTASLLGVVATSLTFLTREQVLWTIIAAILGFFSYYIAHPEDVTLFVFMFYASTGIITGTLAIVKVLLHEREFILRQALAHTMSDLNRERTQKFMQNEQAFLGELSSSVAHEINNPLCTLRFSLERLGEGNGNNSSLKQDLFQRALKQEQRIKTFIDHLLFFSGVHFAENRSLTISRIIQLTSHLLRPFLIKHQTILLANITAVEKTLKSQPQDVAQILYQLVKIATEIMAKNKINSPKVSLIINPLQDMSYSFIVEFKHDAAASNADGELFNTLSEAQKFRLETVQHLAKRNSGSFEFAQNNIHARFQVVLA